MTGKFFFNSFRKQYMEIIQEEKIDFNYKI